MKTLTIVDSALQAETLSSWNQPNAVAEEFQPHVINPSRNITLNDEAYLRDYTLVAAVISWDEGTYNTPDQVVAADITNIAIAGDTVWYQVGCHRAIPLNIETFHSHRLQIQQHQAELNLAEPPQLVGYAGDSVSCQLQPSSEATAEYDSGHAHGMLDAAYASQPMCTEAECPYSAGYLNGYNSFRQLQPQPVISKRTHWSATYDSEWNWYWVWVGDRCVDRASTIEAAERMAQQYIATDELIQRQNAAVMMQRSVCHRR